MSGNITNDTLLGKEIYAAYTAHGFGKVLKSEIDRLVFHSFLLRELPNACDAKDVVTGETIDYFAIDKQAIYKLSIAARIKESGVQTLIENDFLTYNTHGKDTSKFREVIVQMAKATRTTEDCVQSGKVKLLVANPIVKKMLENELAAIGSMGDYSFNKDILTIDVPSFVLLVTDEEDIRKSLFEEMKKENPKLTLTRADFEKKTKGDTAKELLLGAVKFVTKTAIDAVIAECAKRAFGEV